MQDAYETLVAEHAHQWSLCYASGGWRAVCFCGLGVTVLEFGAGRSHWEWFMDGGAPPHPNIILAALSGVATARRQQVETEARAEGRLCEMAARAAAAEMAARRARRGG